MTGRAHDASTSRRTLLRRGAALSGAAVVVPALLPAAARAQEDGGKLKAVLDRGSVIVGTGSANPPFHFEDAEGQLVGFDIEMGRMLAVGLFDDVEKVEFVVQAADARIPNLASDKVDVVFQYMTVNALRAREVEFSIPYYRESATLLFKVDSPYNSAEDLAGKQLKVSILQNADSTEFAHRGVPDAAVEEFDSAANAVLALDSGRVDAAIIDLSAAQWRTSQAPEKYKVGPIAWSPQTYAAAIKPGDQRWLNYINTVLHEAMVGVDFETYRAAFRTYFTVDLPQPQSGFPAEYR